MVRVRGSSPSSYKLDVYCKALCDRPAEFSWISDHKVGSLRIPLAATVGIYIPVFIEPGDVIWSFSESSLGT